MFTLWLGCKIKVSIAFINERVVKVATVRCILLLFLLLLLVLTDSMKSIKYFHNIKLTNGLGNNSITNNNNETKTYKMNTFAQYLGFHCSPKSHHVFVLRHSTLIIIRYEHNGRSHNNLGEYQCHPLFDTFEIDSPKS